MKLHFIKTLFYYDGPAVWLGRDDAGDQQIAVLVDADENGYKFMSRPVYFVSLEKFMKGEMDLRDILEEYDGPWYVFQTSSVYEPVELTERNDPIESSGLLPECGFVMEHK